MTGLSWSGSCKGWLSELAGLAGRPAQVAGVGHGSEIQENLKKSNENREKAKNLRKKQKSRLMGLGRAGPTAPKAKKP